MVIDSRDLKAAAPFVGMVFMQTFAFVWWASSMNSRLNSLEGWATQNQQVIERIKGVEVNVDGIKSQMTRIENKIDKRN